jgi:anti-sigma factor RsiW
MLRCHEVADLASDHIDRALPFGRRLQMHLHLAICRACRAYVDQLRKTIGLIRGRAVGEPPPSVVAAVAEALAQSREEKPQ